MSTNRIQDFVDNTMKNRTDREYRIKKTVDHLSLLSGLKDSANFVPESPNDLFLKYKNFFLSGFSIGSTLDISGKTIRKNDLISLLDALEINFKIRLDYELTEEQRENYKNKISNIVLSKYYDISNYDCKDYLRKWKKHSFWIQIKDVWPQLETDLVYQNTIDKKPDQVIQNIFENEIEKDVDFWLDTYVKLYYKTGNKFVNRIIMTYPPEEVLIEINEQRKIEESMGIHNESIPYAKDLLEDKNLLMNFRRSMKDTSFWSYVLMCYYEEKYGKTSEEYEALKKIVKSGFFDDLQNLRKDKEYSIDGSLTKYIDKKYDSDLKITKELREIFQTPYYCYHKNDLPEIDDFIYDFFSGFLKANRVFDSFEPNSTIKSLKHILNTNNKIQNRILIDSYYKDIIESQNEYREQMIEMDSLQHLISSKDRIILRQASEIDGLLKENNKNNNEFIPAYADLKNLKPDEIHILVDFSSFSQGKELTITVRDNTVKGGFGLLDLYKKSNGKPNKNHEYLMCLLDPYKFRDFEKADRGSEESLTSSTREFNNLFRKKFPLGKQRVIKKKHKEHPRQLFILEMKN